MDFDREPPTKRWLVLVDGLDEVRERDQRTEVLQVAEHAARRASMRFVITSRPGVWDTGEATFTHYTLQPLPLHDGLPRRAVLRGQVNELSPVLAMNFISHDDRKGIAVFPSQAARRSVSSSTSTSTPRTPTNRPW